MKAFFDKTEQYILQGESELEFREADEKALHAKHLRDLDMKLLAGIDSLLKTHLSIQVFHGWLSMQPFKFGNYPDDLDFLKREFIAWRRYPDGSFQHGERSPDGIADGRGIRIDPS